MSRRRDLFQELVTSSTNRLTGLKTDTNLDTKMKSSIAYKGAGQMPKEDDVRKLRLFVGKFRSITPFISSAYYCNLVFM